MPLLIISHLEAHPRLEVLQGPFPLPLSPSPLFLIRTGAYILLAIASSPWTSALIDHFVFGLILFRAGILLFVVVDLNLKLGWGCKRRWTWGVGRGLFLCKFF